MKDKINVLGTEYHIEVRKMSEDNILKDNKYGGYCCDNEPLIIIADTDEKEYFEDYTEKEKRLYISKLLTARDNARIFEWKADCNLLLMRVMVHGREMRKWLTGSPFSPRRFIKSLRNWIFCRR